MFVGRYMGNEKRKETSVNSLTDLAKANRTAARSYIVCVLIYAFAGFFMFTINDWLLRPWKWGAYYLLLLVPLLIVGVDYKENYDTKEFRYNLYMPALFFYGYLLLLDIRFSYIIFAVWVIGTSIIYYDIRFSQKLGFILFAVHAVTAVYLYFSRGAVSGIRMLQSLSVLMLAFFVNYAAKRMVLFQQENLRKLHDQKQLFEALMSVETKKIFEYDPQKDECTLTKTDLKGIESRQKIENFSETAKQYRYVLYADWKLFDEFIEKCRLGVDKFGVQIRLRNQKADYLWYQLNVKTLFDEEGNPGNVVGTMENIDEMKRYELHLQDENMRDPLTKLYKRAYVKELMAEFLNSQNDSEYAGLLIVDIDDFTILCEQMGNTFGDEVIRSIAADIEGIFYTSDIIGRVGGDEFVILMKYIRDPKDIDKKIHELQDVVRKTYTEKEMNFTSTVTIGAAVYPVDGKTFKELYYKAEKALVYAKARGKNRHDFYQQEKESEYDQLEIEAKHSKIEQKNKLELLNQKGDANSLTELAFKLIEESKDTDSAINLLLRQVARQMDLDGICIRRRIGKENKLVYPYRCILGNSLPDFVQEVEIDQKQWENEWNHLKRHNNLICCGDTNLLSNEKSKQLCLSYGVKALARSAFLERGEYIGSIEFLDCRNTREWTKEERVTIQSLTNVISSYLLKMKAFEDASDMVEKLTGYDLITDFYKYEKFLDFVAEYFANASEGKYAVIYMDFSNFKFINECYGYEVGDKILRDYADTARSFTDIFIAGSRVFSDNMVCLIHMIWDSEEQMKMRLLNEGVKFSQKIQKEYLDSNLALNIGVCPFTVQEGRTSFKSIVSNANLARKEAKKPENSSCVIYSEEMGEKLRREVSYANDMESALAKREFVVYLQPKVDLKKRMITGAEALIRWIREDGTMVFPNDFIPVFEKNKTITKLDYFVYEEVCRYQAERIKKKERPLCISMNISRIHLSSADKLISYIKSLISKYEIPPYLLEFELTETVFTDTVLDTIELMRNLRELGVKVSMDDFGSGYSSLNVLTKLPLDVLKLDKDFLKDFENDADGKIIIPSIIDMAKKLDLCVVCEGVETKKQAEFLRQVGCDLVQGYYYAKPVSQDVFSQMAADDEFVIRLEQEKQ